MSRNKYPEVTVERILAAAKKLFLEKGYDKTTIPDIVAELGDLTKGAVYHHFKSKEEIMDALGDKMFFDNNPFDTVKKRTDLNGLQKIREVIKLAHAVPDSEELTIEALPLLKNPRILAGMIESDQKIFVPLWQKLIEEGVADGSIHTQYPRELASMLQMLTGIWLMPSVYPADKGELLHRFLFAADILEKAGLPLVDDELLEMARNVFTKWEKSLP
ncbi:HTH-type transcriptional regulator TtgR [Eubacteriaceae bacterium CHKCI005]|nr:HTH-type transcriptional regulator TtgR [Eubacteriaceae bacterium CHKCI005]